MLPGLFIPRHLAGGGGSAPLDEWSGVTSAYSFSRNLLSSYSGSYYTDSSGIQDLFDQSGNALDLAPGNAPTLSSGGTNSVDCADFDGSNDKLTSGVALSNFLTASEGYLCAAIAPGSGTGNRPIFTDNDDYLNFNVNSAASRFEFSIWDGSSYDTVVASWAGDGVVQIVEAWYTGGTAYIRVDGGSETSASTANVQSLTATAIMGDNAYTPYEYKGLIFEFVTASTVPSSEQRDALVSDMQAHIGT